MTIPNKENFCGGNFKDWLEVMLTPDCNGICSWCIDKDGFRPEKKATVLELIDIIINIKKQNIILLGGEPTLYKELKRLIYTLFLNGRNVYITTNGSNLNIPFITANFNGLFGINISIHDYNLNENKKITGINLNENELKTSVIKLKEMGISEIRLNCNCIIGNIDSEKKAINYINFAKEIGINSVRFSELKNNKDKFIGLEKMFNFKYELNPNPFLDGCNKKTIINGVNVSLRQMCGMQTELRERPENPKQILKKVLFYDGILYDGWPTYKTEFEKTKKLYKKELNKRKDIETGGGCVY
jgi:MoaA/NifB/PqqE/SkfB family radical SAM enzyme